MPPLISQSRSPWTFSGSGSPSLRRGSRKRRVRGIAVTTLVFAALLERSNAASFATYVDGSGSTRVCPPGHFCAQDSKTPCAAGFYNDQIGQSVCQPCPAQASCPQGSVRPQRHVSSAATVATSEASSNKLESAAPQLDAKACKPKLGFQCVDNELQLCPRGYFCDSDGTPQPCPADPANFCPAGSSSPQIVGEGRYVDMNLQEERICERGFYCSQGIRTPCPGGTFGSDRGLSDASCSGDCYAGYYCPAGSVSSQEEPCGGPGTYCPEASASPTDTDLGYYTPANRSVQIACPLGSYCVNGIEIPCPAGSFNDASTGLSDRSQCSSCPAGYVCYASLVRDCGGPHLYCPAGDASSPLAVPAGYYSDTNDGAARKTTGTHCDHSLSEPACKLYGYDALLYESFTVVGEPLHRSTARICERGHYCIDGDRFECPPGRFGATEGLETASCSGICTAGYYCPTASIQSTQLECPPGPWYCPAGTGTPYPVQQGYYVVDDRSEELPCEEGHFCVRGVKRACPAGTYGAEQGLSNALCSGRCPAGYFCPTGSTEARANPCESAAIFCPVGSGAPQSTRPGYYTKAERSNEYECEPGNYCKDGVKRACPAGTYGSLAALSSEKCAGPCPAGFFCPEGTIKAETWTCRDALGLTTDDQTFRANNIADDSCVVHLLDVYPEQFLEFSIIGPRMDLDTASWDLAHARAGTYEVTNDMAWDADEHGFRSRTSDEQMRETKSNETLHSGWRPGSGPKTMCFWKKFMSPYIYGVDGLRKSEPENDYFLVGTHWSQRNRIYASAGPQMGGYGTEDVVIAQGEWMFYCLASGGASGTAEAYVASPSDAAPRLAWSQADNGQDRGVVGGSSVSVEYGGDESDAVYGGLIHWDAHLTAEQILNAHQVTKYFYQKGARPVRELHCGAYPSSEWEQGFLGRHVGPVPSIHYEKDAQGNYQPVRSAGGDFQAKSFVVPNLPRGLDNSEAMLYCPLGSPQPRLAEPGYYTNSARTEQTKCPPGSYCTQGLLRPCPPGTFGDREGLATPRCSGYCPAGAQCPEGSSAPAECPELWYSPPGSASCVACGTAQASCKTSRDCCLLTSS